MFTKPILDEEGNKIGIERWRTSRDPETGEISEVKMGEEMIDKEAEAEQKRIDELNEQAEEEETLQASESIGQTEEDDRAEAADEAKYLWDQYQPLMAAIQQIMQVAEENDLRKEEFIKLAKAQQESQ